MQDDKVVVWGIFTNSQEEKEVKDKAERERFTQLMQSSRK